MARDFVGCQRGQMLLMAPSLGEWLPEDHLVWTVLGAVEQMNLDRFAEWCRLGGAGRAPYDPAMLVALLLYAYARGNRSPRGIERACWEDVAFKVITGMRTPDHSKIAEFRRHEAEIAELFDAVLGLCREAGLVSVGVITIDGTGPRARPTRRWIRTAPTEREPMLGRRSLPHSPEDALARASHGPIATLPPDTIEFPTNAPVMIVGPITVETLLDGPTNTSPAPVHTRLSFPPVRPWPTVAEEHPPAVAFPPPNAAQAGIG